MFTEVSCAAADRTDQRGFLSQHQAILNAPRWNSMAETERTTPWLAPHSAPAIPKTTATQLPARSNRRAI